MRRILLFMLVATGSLILSSCLTIEERISLNADGSGVQTNTIDMSTLLDNPMIKMGMAEELKKQGNDAAMMQRIDSSFNIIDELLPVNPQWTAAERDLVSRVNGNMLMDLEGGEGVITTTFTFNNAKEIGQLATLLANSNKPEGKESNPFSGMSGQDFLISTMSMKGKKFSRTTTKSPDFSNPLAEQGMDEDTMEMMKGMFGDAVFGYRIDFPGKVKKVKGFPGHEIEDNSLIMLFDFMEMLEDPDIVAKAMTGEVKFK